MYESYGLFIGGSWRQAADTATLAFVDPAAEEEIGAIPVAASADLDEALVAPESGSDREGEPSASGSTTRRRP
jgi:succinate-semialdehyde dehydrogenase/glutarate-semialdehyde dehydrogenase